MVKHIVLFKLKETLSAEEKLEIMTQFKNAIESLPASIEQIRHIYVGFNMNPAEQWDLCLDSEFDSLEDVKVYAAHPAHVAAASILKDAKADRSCVDYTF
ncbi:MAG: Dabb family protein [Phocaeicola sp.]